MMQEPTFSVVVPTYDRPARLAACLRALRAQTLVADRFEVIVSDDGGPEPLAPLLAPFRANLRLTLVSQANAGPAAARNRGARHATERILAFIDDDCTPAPDWLEQLAAQFSSDPDALVGGAIRNVRPDDSYAAATQLITDFVYDYYDRTAPAVRFFSTSNLAVPAEPFHRLGGFDESFPHAAGEDYDFCARWHQAGFRSVFAPAAIVGHAHGHDLASFWRQHFGYGRALLRVRQRIAVRSGRRGLRLEAPRFYARLLAYPLRSGQSTRAWRHAALVLLAQIATGAGAAWELLLARRRSGGAADTRQAATPRVAP